MSAGIAAAAGSFETCGAGGASNRPFPPQRVQFLGNNSARTTRTIRGGASCLMDMECFKTSDVYRSQRIEPYKALVLPEGLFRLPSQQQSDD